MSTLRLTTIANQGNTASVPSETVINGSAKAWVNFNGTSTVAIRASFNVTSITDNGTGNYTVNFTNALVDANYAVTGITHTPAATNGAIQAPAGASGNQTTTSVRIEALQLYTQATFDPSHVFVVIHR